MFALSRRAFLKSSGLAAACLAARHWLSRISARAPTAAAQDAGDVCGMAVPMSVDLEIGESCPAPLETPTPTETLIPTMTATLTATLTATATATHTPEPTIELIYLPVVMEDR